MRLLRIAFALLWLFPSTVLPSPARSKGVAASTVDQDYVSALATADRFLHAWQTRDEEAGILLLTDRVKQRTGEGALLDFFSSSTVARESFEIGRGKKLGPNRYEFPVALFERPAGHGHKWMHPQATALVVVKSGSEWAVDKLP